MLSENAVRNPRLLFTLSYLLPVLKLVQEIISICWNTYDKVGGFSAIGVFRQHVRTVMILIY